MAEYNFEPDYAKWWSRKDLTKEQLCWLLLGINPEDVAKQNKLIDKKTPLTDEETSWQNRFRLYQDDLPHGIDIGRTYQQYLKLFNWDDGKEGLVKQAYESHEPIPEKFKEFLIKAKVLKPNKKLERYHDHNQYPLDFKTLDTSKIKTDLDAFAILLGFKPEDFSRFYALERRQRDEDRDEDGFAAYVRFTPEDKWFYSEYRVFIANSYEGRDGHFFAIHAWEEARFFHRFWDGDFAKYAKRLYNEGFIFKQDIVEALKELGITLEYDKDGWAYGFYDYWLRKGGWTQTEAVYLFRGQSPDRNERSFIDLSQNPYVLSVGTGDSILSWDEHKLAFEHLEKILARHKTMKKLKTYKYGDKELFEPKEIISWLLNQQLPFTPPFPLIESIQGIEEYSKGCSIELLLKQVTRCVESGTINESTIQKTEIKNESNNPPKKTRRASPSSAELRNAALNDLEKLLLEADVNINEIPFSREELATYLKNNYDCFKDVTPSYIVSHFIKKSETFKFKKGAPAKDRQSFEDFLLAQNGT